MRKSDDKKSFQLYNDYIDHFSLMSDEEAGKLIKAIFCYVNDLPCEELTGLPLMAFSFIRSQLKRDKDKYDARCEANRINGRLGGRPKKMKEGGKSDEEKKPNNCNEKQMILELTDTKVQEEAKEEKSKQKKTEYTPDFEKFWQVYPRKDDKGEAYKKYMARVKDGWSPDELERAAKNYRVKCEKERTEKKYIKQAKTFLSATTSFMDYLPKIQEQTVQTEVINNTNPFRDDETGGGDNE